MPSNVAPADIAPSDLPDGFTLEGPGQAFEGSGGRSRATDRTAEQDAQRQAILEQVMTPGALARLRRVKIVKKERALAIEVMIANMVMQKKMDSKVTEGKLIEMLEEIVVAQHQKQGDASKISIQRKKYTFDSDDEDDDDDDLLWLKLYVLTFNEFVIKHAPNWKRKRGLDVGFGSMNHFDIGACYDTQI